MSLRHFTAAFLSARDGSFAVGAAVSLLAVAAVGGAAVDYTRLVSARTRLQDLGDAAALAGAREFADVEATSDDVREAVAEVLTLAASPGVRPTVAVDAAAHTVSVQLAESLLTTVLQVVGVDRLDVVAASAAGVGRTTAPICVLSLNDASKQKGGLFLAKTARLDAGACVVWVNSTAKKALVMGKGASVRSAKTCVAGGVKRKKNRPLNVDAPPQNCGYRPDPFAARRPLTPTACSHDKFDTRHGGAVTLRPGVYCGGLKLHADRVTLQPGTYVVRDGKLDMHSDGWIKGKGVAFVLEGKKSTVSLKGKGDVDLSAPLTGDLAGFVFFQRPDAAPKATARLGGEGVLHYEGVLYFPTQRIVVGKRRAVKTGSPFTAYIAESVVLKGAAGLSFGYDAQASVPPPPELMADIQTPYLLR